MSFILYPWSRKATVVSTVSAGNCSSVIWMPSLFLWICKFYLCKSVMILLSWIYHLTDPTNKSGLLLLFVGSYDVDSMSKNLSWRPPLQYEFFPLIQDPQNVKNIKEKVAVCILLMFLIKYVGKWSSNELIGFSQIGLVNSVACDSYVFLLPFCSLP